MPNFSEITMRLVAMTQSWCALCNHSSGKSRLLCLLRVEPACWSFKYPDLSSCACFQTLQLARSSCEMQSRYPIITITLLTSRESDFSLVLAVWRNEQPHGWIPLG